MSVCIGFNSSCVRWPADGFSLASPVSARTVFFWSYRHLSEPALVPDLPRSKVGKVLNTEVKAQLKGTAEAPRR